MFAGITTFGQRASALLNTLDTNFDTMFAPEEPQPPVLGAKRKMGSAALDVGEPDATGMLSAVLGSPRSHNKRRRSRPTLKEAGAKHVGRLVCPLAATPIVRETLAAAAAASVTPGAAGAAGAQQHGGGELRGMMTEPVRLRVTAQLRMLKAQYAKALEDLQAANSRAERLAAENSQLRGALSSSEADPVNDAISAQLQALLADKSKWMEENMRLARENAGLRELLAYTAFQAAEADEGDDDNCYSDEDRVGIMQDLDGADDEGTRGATIEQQQPPGEPEVAGGAVASEANGPDSNTAAAAEDLAATASAASP